ncbi:MAG: UDP-2,3-diacylglucosamine diphosphatase [Epsilonproteobacteria bacterium]|nr:MAG: UDP-2,3-diacylglucosamine diphosphatase [Campylobacterota bacterium]
MIINDGAIFIADSHYNSQRTTFKDILIDIKSKKIDTPQLFLMGDMFDFLSGEIEYFKTVNYQIISLINELSLTIEIIYFEGNHDFNLRQLFPKIDIFSREEQPVHIMQNHKKISLAHGDIFTPICYNIFSSLFRNHYFQKILNIIDINNWLSISSEQKLISKNICHKQNNFTQFIEHRIKKYNTDLVIEGHFHQGYINDKYINVPSLACDKRYMIYKNNQFSFNTL